jgi:acyl-CoA thioester hydrolase
MKNAQIELRVRYVETDQMGVVNHSNYFPWMEEARSELLRVTGLPYGELEARGYFLPVREAYCRYRSSLKYEDLVFVEAELLEFGWASIKIGYKIFLKKGHRLAAEGYTIHAFMDKEGKILKPPTFLKELFT